MDDLKFFLGLGAITIAVIGFVIYVGLKLNNVVNKRSAEISFPLHVTLAGTALWALIVA